MSAAHPASPDATRRLAHCRAARRPAADYEKLGVIGEGTFGVVHRARHVRTGKLVAIKKMLVAIKSGIELATVREIMLLQELHHPNVIELREVYANNGTSGAALHLVSEYCVIDLERVIKARASPHPLRRTSAHSDGPADRAGPERAARRRGRQELHARHAARPRLLPQALGGPPHHPPPRSRARPHLARPRCSTAT